MNIVMLFPGYGSQYVGMGQDLYKNSDIVRHYFKEAQDYLKINIEELCFRSTDIEPNLLSDKDLLDNTAIANLAIYVVSCSTYALLKKNGILPSLVAGYDTGAYAALYAAGGISFLDGLQAVQHFTTWYIDMLKKQKEEYHMIMVCGLTETELGPFLDKSITISFYQTRTQHIISGTLEGIKNFREKLKNASQVTLYDVGIGLSLHSAIMDPVAEKVKEFLNKVLINAVHIPLLSTITAKELRESTQIKNELVSTINKPIRWDFVINQLEMSDLIVGVGPARIITELAREKYPKKEIITIENMENIETVKELIKK